MQQLLEKYFASPNAGTQTALAEEVGVKVQTVNKWLKGEIQPKSFRWSRIEDACGWNRGTIATAKGFTPPHPDVDIAALAAEVQRQGAAISRIEALLDEQDGPRSAPKPTHSREAVPTARRGKVDP